MIFSFFAKREKVFEVKGNEKLYRQAKKILRETGIAISRELVKALKEIHAAGAHLMPVNDVDAVGEIAGEEI